MTSPRRISRPDGSVSCSNPPPPAMCSDSGFESGYSSGPAWRYPQAWFAELCFQKSRGTSFLSSDAHGSLQLELQPGLCRL